MVSAYWLIVYWFIRYITHTQEQQVYLRKHHYSELGLGCLYLCLWCMCMCVCMCMCACMYVHGGVRVCVCVHACVFVCLRICVCHCVWWWKLGDIHTHTLVDGASVTLCWNAWWSLGYSLFTKQSLAANKGGICVICQRFVRGLKEMRWCG